MFFRNRSLLTKVGLVIAAILVAVFALSAFLSYRQQRAFTLDEAVDKARIIAFEAIRAREYLSRELQAGEVELSQRRYGLIPVVASTRIGELVAEDLDYRIRQVSDRYRNPKNAPDPFELAQLEAFRADGELGESYAITRLEGQPVFRYLRPFLAEESCLQCHGEPGAAPAFLHRMFPPEQDRAYNYRLGEVIGAASVTIPMVRLEEQILGRVRNDLLTSGGIFLALITCLGLLMRAVVTRPLALLGEAIGEVVRTGRFERKIPRRGRDEIGTLIDVFNDMIVHLGEKTEHLEESEKRYRLLTETARDGIVSFLANGQIILFNRQAESMFGYSKREILGVSVERLVHQDCGELHRLGAETFLRQESDRLVRELSRVPALRRDGTALQLELSLSVAESDGHLFYTAIVREPA